MTIKERIQAFQHEMMKKNINLYIIPSADPHKSEYVAEHFKSRAYLSGFTGSAGLLVMTSDACHLWTDGRYFIQAERELEGSGIILEKMNEPGVKTYQTFIGDYLSDDMVLGYDQRLFSVDDINTIKASITADVTYEGDYDLVDSLWHDRPSLPYTDTYVHKIEYTGQTITEKLSLIRQRMLELKSDFYIISALNDICWLFNIRANDVAYTPVVYSYALISQSDVMLYLDGKQLTPSVSRHLANEHITIRPYDKIASDVSNIPEGQAVLFDPKGTSVYVSKQINDACKIIEAPEICAHIKARMHPVEIENLKACQLDDGAAMVKFLHWLDTSIGKEEISELDAASKLSWFREQIATYIEPSFNTIPAYMANAAMMHYSTDPENSPLLEPKGLFLIDSGGQYHNGTTDITRTLALGPVSDRAKEDFTLVLKGHIQLARFVFLEGTTGGEMDAIARQPIWQARKDYKSGTGHGIGYLLGVHEGIARIARGTAQVVLHPGMILTNEPGIYIEGEYGIRTENTLLVVKDQSTDFGQFLKFETISFCPIDRRAIVVDMLRPDEVQWLNAYHQKVYNHLAPLLDDTERIWLEQMTQAL